LPTPVVEAQSISKRFGTVTAVKDVSFAIGAGEIFGLIGHNGAGKSTLLRILLGLLTPDAGSVNILDSAPDSGRFRDCRRQIAYLPENVVFYDNLSGLETLRFYAELKGVSPRDCRPLLDRVGLAKALDRPVRGYSKGMRQRLGLAQAMLGRPRLLLLDEPTSGLDPAGIREFYGILGELRERGVTILLSSHNLAEIQNRVDRLALMRLGTVQAIGTVQSLREALDLPVHVRVTLRDGGDAEVRAALAQLPGCALHLNGGEATIDCARRQKMTLLSTLMALPRAVADLHIHEPSLEDVFLGYTEIDPPQGAPR
jgi:Cu-processing system ATP-binding protein